MQKLSEVHRIESADGHPDGVFEGRWSGCVVRWETQWGDYSARAAEGVRGIDVPCRVIVRVGRFFVEPLV